MARNNQDACALRTRGDRWVAVVTDGCSNGAASEVGAALGASWIAQRVLGSAGSWASEAGVVAELDALLPDLDRALARWIGELADPDLAPDVATRFFLFGFLCAVIDGDHATIFGIGDGVYGVGARVHVIDPGPDNAPPYAAYRVLPGDALDVDPSAVRPVIHHSAPLDPHDVLFIGTDGLQPIAHELSAWLEDASVWTRTQALTRRLNLAARRLPDDTTVVALAREEAPCA